MRVCRAEGLASRAVMATYNFDLSELADSKSGLAAVSIVIGKNRTEPTAAKLAESTAHDKPKYSYFTKV
jgi:hypothetical protein